MDDRGYPDQSHEFDTLLHNLDGGAVLRKRKHPAPSLDDIDPEFHDVFNEEEHGKFLSENLKLDHLSSEQATQVKDLVIKHWSVFSPKGQFVPVKDYEFEIDTGSAKPISVKRINYGPRETPIMRKSISKLARIGHIRQLNGDNGEPIGEWMFKALLAPKPHQEHITNIEDFVWRFCVNYIRLNQVTRIVAYPIPRCDSAVGQSFGKGALFWLVDAPHGYHQVRVEKESQLKLAFQGPDAIKWTYTVMPFGPVNCPSVFIALIHDLDSTWKALAAKRNIQIDDDTNSKIIVDDIFSWAYQFQTALRYLECQLQVCQSQNLSLNLKKCHFFPKRVEFVGFDVCKDGNRPAQSKYDLLKSWPTPTTIRDIASFVGFGIFYSKHIPHFEARVKRLREIMKLPYTESAKPHWDEDAQSEFDDIKNAIVSDPCLKRFDHRKMLVIRTDFSALAFGYCALQPGDDKESQEAMHRAMRGESFDFMSDDHESLSLHPVAFGSRMCRGRETRLHSYLGEGYAGDWAINKCRHLVFGMRFKWVTDCYALRFILTYDGDNPAILRLQMRLMCWDMDLFHRNNKWLIDGDYWSRLGKDLCFDPLLLEYINRIISIKKSHPAPDRLPMRPENMPHYRGPRIKQQPPQNESSKVDTAALSIATCMIENDSNGLQHLVNVPVKFGSYDTIGRSAELDKKAKELYLAPVALAAKSLSRFSWAVYAFNSGHFTSSSQERQIPFDIVLACDVHADARALFLELTDCKSVFPTAESMLNHIRSSGDRSQIHGYFIHSQQFAETSHVRKFWEVQHAILSQLRLIRSTQVFVAHVHPSHDTKALRVFHRRCTDDGWLWTMTSTYFPDYGDSITGECRFIFGVHKTASPDATALKLRTPPKVQPNRLAAFMWKPFNTRDYAVSLAFNDESFQNSEQVLVQQTEATHPKCGDGESSIKYFLHAKGRDTSIQAGSSVLSWDSLCPPFDSVPNDNLFGPYFGVEYTFEEHQFIRPISPFEFVSAHNLTDDLSYKLSHPKYQFTMNGAIPGMTSAFLLDHVHESLCSIRDANLEIFEPSHNHPPVSHAQAFLSGSVGVRMPNKDAWLREYDADPETKLIREFVLNPGKIDAQSIKSVHHIYRQPLRCSQIEIENDLLILKEHLHGQGSFIKLQIVPKGLQNIIFVAFHTNPIGGHFNVYRTFHRIKLRYFWPGMYSYIENLCGKCPGCSLSNRTRRKSSELLYNFPVEAPFKVLHIDAYSAGKQTGFEGTELYLIACCGMCTFAVMEPVSKPNSKSFASAIMKVQLRFGFSHTIVVDKDSKFLGEFKDAIDLLHINLHILSGENHNPMLVERICRFLNSGLKIMTNERETIRIALEAILLLLYAWNSCPVPGTDISRSLVAVGREFAFPIDYSVSKHFELTSSPRTVNSYARDLAIRLEALREVAQLLVAEQRAWHRELINASRPDPRAYEIGDTVFARRKTASNKQRERVGKLQHNWTGPRKIVAKLKGASYQIRHAYSEKIEKKHASDLSPYPAQLIPFKPLEGADTEYSQLYKPIGLDPFKEAGIEGFKPPQPFKTSPSSALAFVHDEDKFHFPTLAELNDKLFPFPWQQGEEERVRLEYASIENVPLMYTGPPPSPSNYKPPVIPPISALVPRILKSESKLFFIAHEIGLGDTYEWRLVRVNLPLSMAERPSCLQDGTFIVEFYILHTADERYNGINQRYWLQYINASNQTSPALGIETEINLIRPSDTSEMYATSKRLIPCRRWANLTHESTFIHGPFEWAKVRGRQTRDRIALEDWNALVKHDRMFSNNTPSFKIPSFSVHVDNSTHSIVQARL